MGDLTEHFSLVEFVTSQTAERYGIDNTPSPQIIERLTLLCVEVLEPARAAVGPLRISSGYRCPELNAQVGGSVTSAHPQGYAADVVPLAVSKKTFAKWIKTNCDYDQIILEFGERSMSGEPAWIHVSCDPRTRRQVLRIYAGSGGYKAIDI